MAKLERTEKPINVLLEEWKRAELALPEIQRGYVWKKPQVRDLIESMYKEYPCGLILEWKPPEEVLSKIKLKDFSVEQNELWERNLSLGRKPTFLVLDGQQRLTSLLKVLNKEVDVYFNIEEEKFEILGPKIKG